MSNLIPFTFQTLRTASEIRVHVDDSGNLWFVAKDIATALGYEWNGASRISHVPAHWRGVTSVVTPSGNQDMLCLSEQGLYFFLARSDKPAALPFQKWLAGEVLPAIRKSGVYKAPKAEAGPPPMDFPLPGLPCPFPAFIPNLPSYDRQSRDFDRNNFLWEPMLEWCYALTGARRRIDVAFLEAVTARAAGRLSYSSIPFSALPVIRDWLYDRIDEAYKGGSAEEFRHLSFHTLKALKSDLVMLEAAIEGSDLGEPDLKDALACKTLEIIQQVEALGG
jgi:hypothetical protein